MKRSGYAAVAALLVGGLVASLVFLGNDKDKTAAESTATTTIPAEGTTTPGETATTTISSTPADPTCPPIDGSAVKTQKFARAFDMCIDPSKTYQAQIATDVPGGDITVEFDTKNAPNTSNNFISLARYHYFDGIIFHRALENFVIQGGDPDGTGMGGPGYKFNDEYLPPADPTTGKFYAKYDIVMANSGSNTNGSQFFIITGDEGASLQSKYSKFGRVISGQSVVDEIGKGPFGNAIPVATAHKITKISIEES